MASEKELREPTPGEIWRLVNTSGVVKVSDCKSCDRLTFRSAYITEYPVSKRRKSNTPPQVHVSERRYFAINNEISIIFKELGELYQDCPIEPNDTWRAYQLRINAGRVKLLGFELRLDTLERLRKDVAGFGDGCVEIIRQHIEGSQIERMNHLKTDKKRVAMHNMVEIWGVGAKTVSLPLLSSLLSEGSARRSLARANCRHFDW